MLHSKSFQIPSRCLPCLRNTVFKINLQFQLVSNAVGMHALETIYCFHFVLCSSESFQIRQNACCRDIVYKIFSAVPNRLKYRQDACFRDIVFILFSSVPNRFKCRQDACFRDIVFIFFSAVPNRFKYRQNACCRDTVCKIFSAVPNRFKCRQDACFRDLVFTIFKSVSLNILLLILFHVA